jgi:hypothetical protein
VGGPVGAAHVGQSQERVANREDQEGVMPGYHSSSSETTTVDLKGDRITVMGRLCFSYSADGSSRTERARYVATMGARGWKVGLQLRPGQQVERLSFAGRSGDVVLTRDAQVTEELERAFPCDGGAVSWVGLLPPRGVHRRYTWKSGDLLTICYEFTLTVTDARCLPQALVMALTYENEQFAKHYLLHVLLLTDIPGAVTHASAIVDVGARRIGRPRTYARATRPKRKPAAKKSRRAPRQRRK